MIDHADFHVAFVIFFLTILSLNWINIGPTLKDGLAVSEQGTNAELLLINLVAYNKETE